MDRAEQWAEAAIAAGRYGEGTMIRVPYEQMRFILAAAYRAALKDQSELHAKLIESKIGRGCAKCVTPNGGRRFCEDYGCHDLRDLAAEIRGGQ